MTNADGDMSVAEHLSELRRTLCICIGALVLFSGIALMFSGEIIAFLIRGTNCRFIYTSPEMMAAVHLKTALAVGIIPASPVIGAAVWRFVRPALTPRERAAAFPVIVSVFAMFALGGAFGYKIMLPIMLKFFKTIEVYSVEAYISIADYISFVILVCMIFAVGFELPAAMVLAEAVGVVKCDTFTRYRKHAVVVIFVAAALVTPADVLSMLVTAVPMLGVYEIGAAAVRIRRGRVK